jgi:NAD(P)-dependent dehydrogenase (short-subunit alcohol dehydrogenase family)
MTAPKGSSSVPSLKGKTCLITGVTQGIGRVTAREIGRLGPNMVLIARDKQRGLEVVEEVKAAGNPQVELIVADLSSQAEVRRAAAEFLSRHDRLHLLINNAGALFGERKLTVDGLEMTFALNHLGYFLLTQELLGVLKASAPARIVNVASDAHRSARLDFDDLQCEKGFGPGGFGAYGRSKLANILFTNELAQRLAGTGVTANSLHPGVVATGFGSGGSALVRFGIRLARPFFRTPEDGAKTTIHLAVSPAVEGVTGKYFANSRETRPRPQALDDAAAKRLWQVSEELVRRSASRSS